MRISDWSSDVCSSDLRDVVSELEGPGERVVAGGPLGGEGRLEGEVVRVGHDERVVHVLEHLEARVSSGDVRIELVGAAADRSYELLAAGLATVVATAVSTDVLVTPIAAGCHHQQQRREDGRDEARTHPTRLPAGRLIDTSSALGGAPRRPLRRRLLRRPLPGGRLLRRGLLGRRLLD